MVATAPINASFIRQRSEDWRDPDSYVQRETSSVHLLRLGCAPELLLTLFSRDLLHELRKPKAVKAINALAKKEHSLDLQKILSDLTAEKDRIVRAIEALLESPSKRGPKKGVKRPRAAGKRRGGMTPEGRRRLSLAMKKRWAERKRKKS
jgi:hypothetical protein